MPNKASVADCPRVGVALDAGALQKGGEGRLSRRAGEGGLSDRVLKWLRRPGVLVSELLRRAVWPVASQLVLLLAILQAYSLSRKTYFQRPASVAFDHARQVIDIQEAIGLAVTRIELPLQQWVLGHPWLIDFFNAYYRQFKPMLYIAVTLCVLLAPREYRSIRRVFLIATLIAVPWYALYPLAPPRLMDQYGYAFVDTLAVYGGTQSTSAGLGGANQFAAMPSMHIGWTVIVALWLAAALSRWRIGTLIGSLHVSLMCLAVVVTGNHYVLDIVAGFVVVAVAGALARLLPADLSKAGWARRIRDRRAARTDRANAASDRLGSQPPAAPP